MAEKVFTVGIIRERGFLYYIDDDCNIARSRIVRGANPRMRERPEFVSKTELKAREPGFHYFVDGEGDLARSKIRPGRKPPEVEEKTSIYRKRSLKSTVRLKRAAKYRAAK